MFQSQVIRQATAVKLSSQVAGPDALARGLAYGLPLSFGLWAALAMLIF